MKVEQAQKFIADIAATEKARIEASLVSIRYRNVPGECAVKLQLLRERRVVVINRLDDWPPLQECWTMLLEEP